MEDLPPLSLDGEMSRPATLIVQMLLMLVIVILIAIKIKFSKLQQCQENLFHLLRKQSTKNLSNICAFPGDV